MEARGWSGRAWWFAVVVAGASVASGCGDRSDAAEARSRLAPAVNSALGGAGATCGAPTKAGQVCTPNGWCWQNPTPERPEFRGAWGSGPADVWAAAEPGTLLHFDGSAWSSVDAHTDVQLLAIWGSGAGDVWAVGERGTIIHYDGTTWTPATSPTVADLGGVGGSGADDVWALGAAGDLVATVLRFDGSSWSTVDFGLPDVIPNAVWAAGRDDAWLGGMGPQGTAAVIHWDGTAFVHTNLGGRPILSLWGSSASDVYAVGGTRQAGLIFHYDGVTWTKTGNSGYGVATVWGTGPGDVWVGGAMGRVDHFDGTSWTRLPTSTLDTFFALWGSGASDVWAFGIGTSTSSGEAWLHWNGSAWSSPVSRATFDDQVAIAAVAPDDIYFVGRHRTLVHYDGQTLSPSSYLPGVFYPTDAFAASAEDVWVVGTLGSIVRGNARDGWQTVDSGTTAALEGVHGTGPNDVWIVGDGGTVLHWNGVALAAIASGTTAVLNAVHANSLVDAWIVGEGGIALHWAGLLLLNVPTGSAGRLWRVDASAPNDVWAAGDDMLHFDGLRWQSVRAGLPSDYQGLLGFQPITFLPRAPDDVWIVGSPFFGPPTAAYHFDGASWAPSSISASAGTVDATVVGSQLWSVGAAGTIQNRACGLADFP